MYNKYYLKFFSMKPRVSQQIQFKGNIMVMIFSKIILKEFNYYNSMKSFPKVQKKGIMSARSIENNRFNNSFQNFDQMVQKQLEDDFKVHEYLNENPNEGHNTEQYISLFNTLLVKKKNKIKRKQLLKSTKANFATSNLQQQNDNQDWSRVNSNTPAIDSYYSEEEYLRIKQQSESRQEEIEQKTEEQLQMKRILIKQITEKKKSLNLLKGDIGHMIARNQSISVLESKVNKVSLVSENQLKRVSMALMKDKEEVQLRQQMQKKFHNKLKGVENFQSKNLKKIKASYIESMNRRKQIFDKLSLIQKECMSIEQYSDKLKQKQQKNLKTIECYKLLTFVSQGIDNTNKEWKKFQNKQITLYEYSQHLKKIFDQKNLSSEVVEEENIITVDQITPEKLEEISEKILKEYELLQKQTQQKKKQYNQHMSSIEQFWCIIFKNVFQKKQLVKQFNTQERINLNQYHFPIEQYFSCLNRLQRNFKVIYRLIDFLNKKLRNFNGIQYVSELYNNHHFHLRIWDDSHLDSAVNFQLFEKIQIQLKDWFILLKQNIIQSQNLSEQTKQQLLRLFKKRNQQQQAKMWETNEVQKSCFGRTTALNDYQQPTVQQIEGQCQQADQNQLYPYKQTFKESKSISGVSAHSRAKGENVENQVAKRVQLLETIDQSYYSMIKQTIQMQRDNTKKNYQFQRSFKRNKYSSQDELLEEKRFEATFSNLFKQDPDDLNKTPKIKHQNWKFYKSTGRDTQPNRPTFSSLHSDIKNSKVTTIKTGIQSYKKNVTFWEQEKKKKFKRKLRDVLLRC